ncbi:MAG: PTS sugar transporter subunit IIA [Phycisphaerae bacterium]
MKLTDCFEPNAVIVDLKSRERNGVIRELVSSLVSSGAIRAEHEETLARALIQRENQGSTGFGKGVAVPHVKHEVVQSISLTVGRSIAGIDFAALDRAPVYIVFVLLSPEDKPDDHLAAMETVFKYLQRDNFRKFLRQAETQEEIIELIGEADDASDD